MQTTKKFHFFEFVLGVFVALFLTVFVLLESSSVNKELQSQLSICEEEARAWYNASVTQADAYYKYFAFGQNPMTLDLTISQNFATKGHELTCIENAPPRGE
jgi:hypothetical protein